MVSKRGVISYPVPLFSNLPIHAEYYLPQVFVISNITIGMTTIVNTTLPHDYVIGQLVRLIIPRPYGTIQLNQQRGYVVSIPSPTQVELNINSHSMDTFIAATYQTESPQIAAIGDINTGATNACGRINQITYIDGSFRNISPL